MEVCRLCLELLPESNSVPLEGNMREMMLIVSPEMNLEISKSPVACIDCSGNLEELFVFKTKYFDNEESVRSKINAESKNKYNLSEILKGPVRNGSLAPEISKERTCRICLESIENESFTIMKPTEPDIYLSSMLTMCLPEIEIDLTLDPVMCEMCLSILQKLYHFKSTCVDIEEKLVNFCEMHGTNSNSQINLHNLLEINSMKTEIKTECELDYSTVKQEHFHDEENLEFEGSSTDMELSEDILKEEIDLKLDESEIKKKKMLNPSKFPCSMCDKSFSRRYRLEDHKVTHSEKAHECSYCGKTFAHNRSLRRHIRYFHTKCDTIFQCPACEKTFPNKPRLEVHIKNHHSGRKWPDCEVCGKRFFDLSTLRRHMTCVHMNEKKFSCDHCGKLFAENRRLEAHRLQHLVEKPKKVVEPFQAMCDLCNKPFFDRSTLRRHNKSVHNDAKNYICPSCPKKYSAKSDLTRHIKRTHGKSGSCKK